MAYKSIINQVSVLQSFLPAYSPDRFGVLLGNSSFVSTLFPAPHHRQQCNIVRPVRHPARSCIKPGSSARPAGPWLTRLQVDAAACREVSSDSLTDTVSARFRIIKGCSPGKEVNPARCLFYLLNAAMMFHTSAVYCIVSGSRGTCPLPFVAYKIFYHLATNTY